MREHFLFNQTDYTDINPSLLDVSLSLRKVKLVFDELRSNVDTFEYTSFDKFKHDILSAVSPESALCQWQAIASRR